jgi:uridylate kinase
MAKDGVDGVYSDDPKKNKQAQRYDHLTFQAAIQKKLKVMDLSALEMCLKHNIKILVFNIERPQAIVKALQRQIPTTEIIK